MNKFKFESESSYGGTLDSKTTKEFQSETLTDVLFHFTDFLRGVGYVFDGEIGIISEQSVSEQESDGQIQFKF